LLALSNKIFWFRPCSQAIILKDGGSLQANIRYNRRRRIVPKSVGDHSSWILYGGRLEEGICYHEEESPPIYWPQQYQEEECQSQLVVNPNGHYMEDEGAYYHEQVVSLRSKEVVENQVDERKEGQTEVPQEPHKEKEESTKTSSTLALILETL
jgi:hypothetical protein